MIEEKTDKAIVLEVIDALGLKSINHFAKELGYSNSSAVFNLLSGKRGRSISEGFIKKVVGRYPRVNEQFLRKKSEVILIEKASLNPSPSNYTLNDLPALFIELLQEQKKTNELLKQILDK